MTKELTVRNRGDVVHRLIVAGWLLALSPRLAAQATGTTTGDVRGRVEDASGAVVAGALVTATSSESGLSRPDVTGEDGAFVIRLLPPGHYRLTASRTGFRTAEVEDVPVTIGTSTPIVLRLEVEAVEASVEVSARPDLIDPTATDLVKTIGQRRIR